MTSTKTFYYHLIIFCTATLPANILHLSFALLPKKNLSKTVDFGLV